MKRTGELLDAIRSKVMRLEEYQRKSSQRDTNRENEIERLKKQVEDQLVEIKFLEEKLKTIKLAKITETKEGVADAKLKISEMVREIDKCIGLLNT